MIDEKTEMKIRAWSRDNFNKLDEDVKKRCVDQLAIRVKPAIIKDWFDHGLPPGFHFFNGGMQVRNILREILHDDKLPIVEKDCNGAKYNMRNWDDYYMGAVHELLVRHFEKEKSANA